jgi:hypothetical protein
MYDELRRCGCQISQRAVELGSSGEGSGLCGGVMSCSSRDNSMIGWEQPPFGLLNPIEPPKSK